MKRSQFTSLWLALILVAVPTGSQAESQGALPDFSIPQIEALGKALYLKDRAAWLATDALRAAAPPDHATGLKGWVTIQAEDGLRVRFVGGDTAFCSKFDVPVSKTAGSVEIHEECQPLTELESAMFRARQTATEALKNLCSKRYNSVVLPAEMVGKEGWLVYLLAATTTPGKVLVGGHKRVHVSADGRSVKTFTDLSNSCLTLDLPSKDPAATKPAALIASHVLSGTPIETHVFLGLQYNLPFLVPTSEGVWSVSTGKIRYESSLEDLAADSEKAKQTEN